MKMINLYELSSDFFLFGHFSVAVDLVSQKISYFDESNGAQKADRRSLLDDYLLNPKLDLADVVGMACDLLLTGVDTVHFTQITLFRVFFVLIFYKKISSSSSFSNFHFFRYRSPLRIDNIFRMFFTLPFSSKSTCTRESISRSVNHSAQL